MTPDGVTLWKIELLTNETVSAALESVLGEEALSFSRFEEKRPDVPLAWRVRALVAAPPDTAALTAALAEMLGVAPAALPAITAEALPDEDWLALNRRQFPPISAGRFFIHGSHFEGTPPAGTIALRLNAGPAFGSGTHETTQGCLLAIDALLTERPAGAAALRALDVGCGSGILALAIAAACVRGGIAVAPVVASDIDPIAADTTLENAMHNGLVPHIAAYAGEGVSGEGVTGAAPYDLIVANILAEPLIALAPALAGLLAPRGRLVLSGLLTVQEAAVLAPYRAAGLSLRRIIALGEWSTMILGEDDEV